MVFLSLLKKEMRLRLRRERTIWVIITYVLFLGLLGWLFLNNASNSSTGISANALSDTGSNLYSLLAQVQLCLIIFITPSLTATVINGEKERQTYEMLLCSRLSAFSLIMGKLGASLINALLLIAASVPLFSLVFFFGGVGPGQIGSALVLYVTTVLWLGALGLFCSATFQRPAISTAIAYMVSLVWMMLPLLISIVLLTSGQGYRFFQIYPVKSKLLFVWNPLIALTNITPNNSVFSSFIFFLNFGYGTGYGGVGGDAAPVVIGNWHLSYWVTYSIISAVMAFILILLSMLLARPRRYASPRRSVSQHGETKITV
ncbi:ABC transporter permease [Dictyobacter aurantiacus]|uniref:ABC transporter permease n=1 Tax=Dictyobacter aurantiacus TaxID=1936993 RepID=A0A401ZG54_9CHLR|nr:ABC transporter permease [Dictyobacter aurantiacus]GCE05842.1 ABC transporter permease [Dictyobacter aurantiacus]